MNLSEVRLLRQLLCELPSVTEEMPFGPDALVYKILGLRMFALLMWNRQPLAINLKCDPNQALILREQYDWVTPGYHMNKQHWNTINLGKLTPGEVVIPMIHCSYQLVARKLNGSARKRLAYENGVPFDQLLDSLGRHSI